ncbi:MAG TPA: hypothetical protein VKQ28_03650 [Candidatus Acidoferrum sp.]|nr:hypothetical protein [Candidatus Acidoferrum sp.]
MTAVPFRKLASAGNDNGELLSAAETRGFDVFLTLDKGFEYEHSLTGRSIAVLILRAKSSQIDDLLPLIPHCLAELHSIQPGNLVRLGA